MKRKIIMSLLALAMLLTQAIPAFAHTGYYTWSRNLGYWYSSWKIQMESGTQGTIPGNIAYSLYTTTTHNHNGPKIGSDNDWSWSSDRSVARRIYSWDHHDSWGHNISYGGHRIDDYGYLDWHYSQYWMVIW